MLISRRMASLFRLGFRCFANDISSIVPQRGIAISSVNRLKEIQEIKNGKELVVEGVYVPSPYENLLVKPKLDKVEGNKEPCYMCALDLDLKHTDVMILSQFVRSDGCHLPRRITGLCKKQQKYVMTLVTMAQKAGLMINLTPDNCKKDPKKRFGYKKFNTYFDEKTVFAGKQPKQKDRFKR